MGKVQTRCDQYEASTPYHAFRPVIRSLLDVELTGDAGAQPNGTRGATRPDRRRPRPLGTAVRCTTRHLGLVDARSRGARSRLLAGAAPRRSGPCSRERAGRSDPHALRGRPLDGRCLLGSSAVSGDATADQAVARVHDTTPGRRRLRGRGRLTGTARDDAPARGAARRGRKDLGPGRGGRPAAHPGRAREHRRSAQPGTRSSFRSSRPRRIARETKCCRKRSKHSWRRRSTDSRPPTEHSCAGRPSSARLSPVTVIAQVLEGEEDASRVVGGMGSPDGVRRTRPTRRGRRSAFVMP